LLTGKLDRIFAVTDELIFRVRSLICLNDSVLLISLSEEILCCCEDVVLIDVI